MGSNASFSILWMISSYLFITYNQVDGITEAASGSPKLMSLDATCSATAIRVNVTFDKAFDGIIYSKGAFYTPQCVFVLPSSGEKEYSFEIPLNECDTLENKPAPDSKTGQRSFENTIVIQSDAHFQDIFDLVRRIRCTTASQYEKFVDFLPINVNMKDVVTASFTGDDVKVSIDVKNGRGPFAPSLNQGFIQIGDTVTLVVYMSAGSGNWDLQMRGCIALDSKERGSLTLQDHNGCITKPKIMTPFALTHDTQHPDVLIAYAYMKAFRFPDDMQVQIKCVVAVCRDECAKMANCNDTDVTSSSVPPDQEQMDDSDMDTTTAHSNTQPLTRRNHSKFSMPLTRDGRAVQLPALVSHFQSRVKRQADSSSGGTLPLKRVFNVISPEDIASLRNSSIVMVAADIPPNSLCLNQAMFILLMAFLFALIMSGAIALTIVCLRNRALRKDIHNKFGAYTDPRF